MNEMKYKNEENRHSDARGEKHFEAKKSSPLCEGHLVPFAMRKTFIL